MVREKEIAGTPPLDMMNEMDEQGQRYICSLARISGMHDCWTGCQSPKACRESLGSPLKRLMNEIRVWPPSTAAAYPRPPSKNGCMHGNLLGYFLHKSTASDRRLCQRVRIDFNLALLESFCS